MTDIACVVIGEPTHDLVSGTIECDLHRETMSKGTTLSALQAWVGGLVEAMDLTHPDTGSIATLWSNDDGKMIELPRNHHADIIAALGGWKGREWGDFIVGPVVLTGFDPATGETIAVPEEWAVLAENVKVTLESLFLMIPLESVNFKV